MPVLLPNVYVNTARSAADATGQGAPVPYLQWIYSHIEANTEPRYTMFGENAISANYVLSVDSGTDIVEQDRIASIYLRDMVTPWPGDVLAQTSSEYWLVTLATEQAPGINPERLVFIKRVRGGGMAHP